MKVNQWTLGLAAAGVISFGAVAQADEKPSQQVMTLVSATTLSGYVSTAATWSPGKTTTSPGYSYSGGGQKLDGFNLNVVDIAISKSLDESQWAAGYTAEFWFGPDAGGLGNTIAGAANSSSIAIKQANVALNAPIGNGLNLKLGIFDSPLGYETANATENPNYTRSYSYSVEPTSLTGLLASYKVSDNLSLTALVANQLAAAINTRGSTVQSQKTYGATASLTAPDSWGFLKGTALTVGVIDGISSVAGNAGVAPDATLIYVGATIPSPWEKVKFGAAYDHVNVSGNATTGKLSDTDIYAIYASYSGIDKLKINTRLEYLDNNGGLIALNGTGAGRAAGNANAEVVAATVTFDYSLWANVISRVEYRWDHDASGGRNLPGSGAPGVGGVTPDGRNNSHLIALNVIYKF